MKQRLLDRIEENPRRGTAIYAGWVVSVLEGGV
jgi:hypothetical protein